MPSSVSFAPGLDMRYCRTIRVIDAVLAYGFRSNMEGRLSKESAIDGKAKSIEPSWGFVSRTTEHAVAWPGPFLNATWEPLENSDKCPAGVLTHRLPHSSQPAAL